MAGAIFSILTVSNAAIILVFYYIGWMIYCRTFHPLAHIPGPLWPAVSRTWLRLYHMARGDVEKVERKLHDLYGPLVRISPVEVICNDPASIPIIYRTQNPLPKASWYKTFRAQGLSEHADLFTELDEDKHARYRKIVSPAYQMSSVLKNEAAMDECTKLFQQRLFEFSQAKKSFDLGHWLEMYAYDVIGRVLYGQMLGFLEQGKDVGRWIESTTQALPLLHIAASAPSYMLNPVMMCAMLIPGTLKNFNSIGKIADQAKEITQARSKESTKEQKRRTDIMSQLFAIMKERGDEIGFTEKEITLESWAGIIAGADSVATQMRATLYYLMKNSACYAKAIAEIADADNKGLLSSPIQYGEAMTHLPYVGACLKEAQRLFPSFAIRMSRVAPTQGLDICDLYIPAGYWIGINAAIVQYDKGLFGADADEFRPERWLESQEKSFAMDKAMLIFGSGTRTCVGKHIALAESHKLVPEVLRHFNFSMAHDREWKTRNAGFIKNSDIIVNVEARQ